MAKRASPKLTPSMEDYLEATLLAIRASRVARVRDIARRLSVGMPAVTAALKSLSQQGLVNYEAYQFITLTDRGRQMAEEISGRHRMLAEFFSDVLGLDSKSAQANACRAEHAMDKALLSRLNLFAQFVRQCPRAGNDWVEAFVKFCSRSRRQDRCRRCLNRAVKNFKKTQSQQKVH